MRKGRRLVLAILVFFGVAGAALATETITYSYDVHGRLVGVSHAGSVNNNVVANYTYDSADNRNTVVVTGAP